MFRLHFKLHIQPHNATMGLLHVRSLTLSIQGHYYVQSRVVTTFLEALKMRADTYTYHAVIDGPAITVNSDLTDKPSKGPGLEDVSVCARCSEEIFSPVTWAHLRGDTLAPPIPNVDSDTSDYHIMNDLDFVVRMFNAGQNPRKRGPMVDFKIPAKDLLKSSQESCGFCKLLVRLDRHGRLPAQPDETSVLRLQAFWPEKVNGSIYPMMLEVGLHPSVSGGGEAWPLTFFDERGRYVVRLLRVRSLRAQGRYRFCHQMQMLRTLTKFGSLCCSRPRNGLKIANVHIMSAHEVRTRGLLHGYWICYISGTRKGCI